MMDYDFELETILMERKEKTFGNSLRLYDCTFHDDRGGVPQLHHARKYLDRWQAAKQNHLGLLFWGKPGTGKTFAAACIANGLIETKSPFIPKVRMLTFATILTQLLAKSPQDKEFYLEDLCGCDLLILDDFGMERQTEYAQEQVFYIVDGRYQRQLPMIVTTNLSLREFKNPQDITRQRIYDRILEMCIPVCFDAENQRQGRAKQNLLLYKEKMETEKKES